MHNILGFNFGHDGSAAVLKNGRLVCAISNERLSRKKKAEGVTAQMVDYVLDAAGLKLSDIDLVGFSSFFYSPGNYIKVFGKTGVECIQNVLDLNGGVTTAEGSMQIGPQRIKAFFVHHHLCHAASAFYTSPFDVAACFTLDASRFRPEACSLFAYGQGNKVHYLYCPGLMIGNAYADFTEKLGLGLGLLKAGTTMALASFGKPLPAVMDKCEYYGRSWYERTFQDSDPVFINTMWSEISGLAPHVTLSRQESDSPLARDIAASLQYVFEESILSYTKKLYEQTRSYNGGNLCLSGGSFLNSNTNMRLKLDSPFKNIHLLPACGDDGLAIGSAMYLAHHYYDVPRQQYEPHEYMYLGKRYAVPPTGEPYDAMTVARELSEGKIVAFFREGSEFGPRALGHRSILADPRNPQMKDILNQRVKRREWFRPFAPVVLSEKANKWFEIDFESKLMLFIAPIRCIEKIPAVSHVDGSARLQTLQRQDNPVLYDLIEKFESITGVPILLNTSLNVNNEPLVETPQDALNFFNNAEVDLLVLEDRVLRKPR